MPVVAWIILGLILLILLVVLFVPVGADIGYVKGTFSLAARVDGFAIQLLPQKPEDPNKPPKEKKEKKPKKPKPPKETEQKTEEKPEKKLDFTIEEILELAKKVIKGLGKFGKLTVRRFMLHFVAAGEDPYNTAMTYNYVNAALCSMAPLCARKFRVTGDVDVWTDIDFAAEKMQIDAELSMTLRLVQLIHVGFSVAIGALSVLIKNRLRLRREARQARKNPPALSDEKIVSLPDIQETTTAEERKESHG